MSDIGSANCRRCCTPLTRAVACLIACFGISLGAGSCGLNAEFEDTLQSEGSAFPGTAAALGGPIVLAHGFGASKASVTTFFGVKDALERDGHFVVVTEVQPFASVEARAGTLAPQLDRAIADFCSARKFGVAACPRSTRVNIIAHSMGGLDARYAISRLGYGARVASLTTISTPHHGSMLADAALGLLGSDRSFNEAGFNRLATAFGLAVTSAELAKNPDLRAGAEALTVAHSAAFNAATADDARVYYASWAGVSKATGGWRFADEQRGVRAACGGHYEGRIAYADFMNPQLVLGASVVSSGATSLQDGLVTIESAKHGNFQGCIGADHLQEVGQPFLLAPDVWTGFDHVAFYRGIARDLGARGF